MSYAKSIVFRTHPETRTTVAFLLLVTCILFYSTFSYGAECTLTPSAEYGMIPLEVKFLANLPAGASGSNPTLTWNYGDGTEYQPIVPWELETTHIYEKTGVYIASFEQYSVDSELIRCETLIYASSPISAEINATPTSGTTPLKVNFNLSVTGGLKPFTYNWFFNNGGVGSTTAKAEYTYESSGDHEVYATITDQKGQVFTTNPVTIHVEQPLHATIKATPARGEAPLVVAFEADVTGGVLPYAYSWTFGDETDTYADLEAPVHEYEKPGSYKAGLKITDASGTVANSKEIVVLVSKMISTCVITAEPVSGFAPLTVSFSVDQGDAADAVIDDASWSFGDESDSETGVLSTSHTFSQQGVYTVLFVNQEENMDYICEAEITVEPPQPLKIASIKADPSLGASPLSVTFTAEIEGGVQPYNYKWQFGDGTDSNEESPTHIYVNDGNEETASFIYKLSVLDATGQTTDLSAINAPIKVKIPKPPVDFSVSSSATGGVAPLDVTVFVNISEGEPPYQYTYDFGDGTVESGAPPDPGSLAHTYAAPGDYTVTVTVQDAGGSKTGTISINVADEEEVDESINTFEQDAPPQSPNAGNLFTWISGLNTQAQNILTIGGSKGGSAVKVKANDALNQLINYLNSVFQKRDGELPDKNEIATLMKETGKLFKEMAKNNVPMNSELLDKMATLASLGLKAGLTTAPQNLASGTDAAWIPIGALYTVTRTLLIEDVDPDFIDAVLYALSGRSPLDLDKTILDQSKRQLDTLPGNQNVSIKDILDLLTKFENPDAAAPVFDPLTGTAVIQLGGQMTSLFINKMGVVPENAEMGVFTLNSGLRLGVTSYFAVKLTPAPLDAVALASFLASLGLKPFFTDDGRLVLDMDNGEFLITGISYNVSNENPGGRAGTVSFGLSGMDPTSQTYSVLVDFGRGTQEFPPMIYGEESFASWLKSVTGQDGAYSIDRDTGVLDLSAVGMGKWKPDYVFESLSGDMDKTFDIVREGGGLVTNDVAFEFGDFNGDTKMDVRFYSKTPQGRQVLYPFF